MPILPSNCPRRLPAALSAAILLAGIAGAHPVVPRPAFAHPVAFEADSRPEDRHGNQGFFHLLSEEAVDIPTESHYHHLASKALSSDGLEEVGHISVSFDTSYQRVDFHRITIWRGGKPREILPDIRPSALRRETDLEAGMLDGTRTLLFTLEDVRVGDIVESEYTLKGFNPVFGKKASGGNLLGYGVPVDRIRIRLLQRTGDFLHIVRRSGAGPYLSSREGDRDAFSWELSRVAPVMTDFDAPSWHDAFPRIQWGEYSDWGEVAAWALPLYSAADEPLPPPLARLADGLKSLEPGEAVRRALRFVQDDIRYLGLEMGTSSHKPAAPAVVYGRRFGDCKDKTVLLCAILRRAGIQADPVLVNTWARRSVAEYNPSPSAFNHVITRVTLPAGNFRHHYLDPTLKGQRGDPLENQFLDYGKGLPVEAGAYDFDDIEVRHPSRSRMEIRHAFDVEDVRKPAALSIATTYTGAEADAIRPQLASTSQEELGKNYLNYLSRHYPHARAGGPVAWEDDSVRNVIIVRERYAVDSLCAPDNTGRVGCSFMPQEVSNFLAIPDRKLRTSPYALAYPKNVTQEIEIRMPESFSVPRSTESVRHASFSFDWDERLSGKVLNMRYVYSASDDHVALDKFPGYIESLERIWEILGTTLYPESAGLPGAGSLNWLLIFYCGFCLAAGIWASRRFLMRPVPAPSRLELLGEPVAPRPIGGLLLLMAIGIASGPFVQLYHLRDYLGVFNLAAWNALTMPGQETYHPAWMPVILFELLANGILLGGMVALWFLFFWRMRAFPRAYVLLALYGIAADAIDSGLMLMLPSHLFDGAAPGSDGLRIAKSLIWAAIWCTYLLKSRRVKETFVFPLPEAEPPAPGRSLAAEAAADSRGPG